MGISSKILSFHELIRNETGGENNIVSSPERTLIVYAHGRRLCSNGFQHGCSTISHPQCSLTFMCERYLHRCREQSFAIPAYAIRTMSIDVVSDHKGRKHCYHRYHDQSYKILQNSIRYHKIAECIARYK